MAGKLEKLRRDYRETTARIRELMSETARNHYELGRALTDAREREVYRAGPHRTFEAYVRGEFGISDTTARKLIAVAEHFNPDIAGRFGLAKLEAAVDYARATRRREQAGDLLTLRVSVQGEDGRFVNKSLRDATPRELRAATSRVRKSQHGGLRTPPRLRAGIETLEENMRELADESFVPRARVWRAKAKGAFLITISGVPVDKTTSLGRLLLSWRPE